MDPWAMLFLGCFLFGILFIGVSFMLGSFGGGDHGHSVHVDHHFDHHIELSHADGHVGDTGDPGDLSHQQQPVHHAHSPSPINLNTITIFLTWFGGIGYVLSTYSTLGLLLILPVSLLAGFAGAAVIFLFLARFIYPNVDVERFSTRNELPGTLAQVTSSIHAGGVGEITYSKGGTRRADGARSLDGNPIPRDTEVVIVRYENGIAYVQPFEQFLAASDERKQLNQPIGQRVPELRERVKQRKE